MATSFLTVSSGVKRELHLLRCSYATKAPPGPRALCSLPSRPRMSHPTCHLLSLLLQRPGPPLSSSACSPPRAPGPQGCSLPPCLALVSAEDFASSGLGRRLRAPGPWRGLAVALVASSARRRPPSLSGKPRSPPGLRAGLPPQDTAPLLARPGPALAVHRLPDSAGSGSEAGGARLGATGWAPRGPPDHMLPRPSIVAALEVTGRIARVCCCARWGLPVLPPDLDFWGCLGAFCQQPLLTP